MRKHSVPAAPLPSWAKPNTQAKKPVVQKLGSSDAGLPALDAEFLRGVYRTLLWFGALLSLASGVVTQNLIVAWSFALGVALAAGLLKTQEIFAHYLSEQALVRRAAKQVLTGRQIRLPMYAFSGVKYLGVAFLLWFMLRSGWMWPVPFALGFTTLQVVIVGKVLGRALQSRMRPLREVYVRPRQSTL